MLKEIYEELQTGVHRDEEQVSLVIKESIVDRDESGDGEMHDTLYYIIDHKDVEDLSPK